MPRRTPDDWSDLIQQAISFKEDFCGSNYWHNYREYYRGNFSNSETILSSDMELNYNLTYAMARNMVPNIYFRNPYITVTPRFKPGLEMHAKIVEAMDNYLIQEMNFKEVAKTAVLDSFLCGRGIFKIGYDSEYGYSTKDNLVEMGINDATSTQFARGNIDKEKIEYNVNVKPGMPWVVRVDPDLFFVPFGTRVIDECDWVDHTVIRQLEDLKKDPKYENTRDLEGTHLERTVANSNKRRIYQEYSKHLDWVEIHEIRDARNREIVCLVDGESGKIIRGPLDDELQIEGLPYVSFAFNEDPEFFWAQSDVKLMESQQLEMNETRTQTMKHRRIALKKFLVQERGMDPNEADKMLSANVGPLAFTKGNPNEVVRELQPYMPADLIQWPETIRADVREMFGTGRQQMGSAPAGRRTKYEMQVVQSAHELRMDERRDAMADAVTKVLRKVNQVCFKFWDTPRVVQVVGYDGARYWVEYTPEALRGEYDIKVDVESLTPQTKRMKREEIMQLMQALGQNPYAINYLMQQLAREFEWLDVTKMFPQAQGVPGQQPGQPMGQDQFMGFQQQLLQQPQMRQQRVKQNMKAMGG